ncbi:nucleoside phosphorylase [Nonomuraea soli]|uniref:Uridine phosphorylase n=1 Tax=Nonomuraea soli TaxID=1032476 RepID=A0A7W0CHX3_9ACTN|nr:nucleoside phosphorylase [Nonomuraea soli]MBA2891245.1 uridine phosphorylase [Nonomuraea soli]
MTRSARDPWREDTAPHLPARLGDLPPVCLLPGDPARVDLAAGVLDDFEILGHNREFRLGAGTLDGVRIAVCSTGIGGPSAEITVVELARLGVRTVLRTGGMGALREDLAPGSVCAVSGAVPGGGAGTYYSPGAFRTASADVLARLHDQAARLGIPLTEVRVASIDSYYLGQGRPLPGYETQAAHRFKELQSCGVDGVDMETETVLAVARAVGLRAGALLVAHANRATDAWLEDYEPAQLAMLRLAVHTARVLEPYPAG